MKTLILLSITILFSGLLSCGGSSARTPDEPQAVPQATISWLANTESNIAGYRLYQSVASGVYGTAPAYLTKPDTLSVTVTLPQERCSVAYFWAVTAFNFEGKESRKSVEVSKTIIGSQYWIGACKK
jgi:hypothetical protein